MKFFKAYLFFVPAFLFCALFATSTSEAREPQSFSFHLLGDFSSNILGDFPNDGGSSGPLDPGGGGSSSGDAGGLPGDIGGTGGSVEDIGGTGGTAGDIGGSGNIIIPPPGGDSIGGSGGSIEVPEPTIYLMMGAFLLITGYLIRKRKSQLDS